jgi:hypothetical protein
MATVIGVGMQMTASAAGMTKGLSEGERALGLLQKIVEQNQQSMARFGQQATKTSQQLDGLTKTTTLLSRIEIGRLLIDGAQAIGSAFSSIANQVSGLVSNVNSSIDTLNDLSARTGIGVEQLQKYAFAAKLAGVDTAQFGTAVQKLAVNIGKATPGGELDKSLRAINLSVTQLRALAPEQQFSVIGQAISQLPTAADRAAASVAVFGKQGAALAPLFREGAASIEELQARAERLGVIVSETQVNNVAAMNDAFDTVRATIQGIIGQVIGNLAPAVTAVTEEFLRFVEEWSGTQGQGGTGIANAITDVLLRGAEYFASVFDKFVADFGSFLPTIENVSTGFLATADTLIGISETFRALFNIFEIAGNALAMALGKFLEGIGSWVSDDVAEFGRELQAQSQEAYDRNARELEAAASNAANAVVDVFTGGEGGPQQAGRGAASQFLQGLQRQIQESRKPEVQVQTNLARTQKDLDQFLKTATDGGSEFLQQSQGTLETYQQMIKSGETNATVLQIMEGFMKNLNAELQKEKGFREEARAAAEAQVKADQSRIANLEKANQAQNKIADDLAAVEREQLRVQKELNAARDSSQRQQADQATARLAQLDQLQASLQEQQQAATQGFAEGFTKTFDVTTKGIEDLIRKTDAFGEAGLAAAQTLRDGIAETQDKVRQGFLSREAYEQEIAARRQAFELTVAAIRQEEQEKLAAAKRVDDFLRTGIDARRQAELDATAQLEERRKQAAQNVAAIQARIDEEARRNQEARDKGNLRDARDSATRLRQLRGLQREEERIAEGTTKRVQQTFSRASQQQNSTFDQFANAASRQVQQFNNAVTSSIGGVNEALAASADGMRSIFRQQQASLMLGPQQIAVADARTAEGQQMILDAAAQSQDPRLIAARQTNRILQQMATGLTNNLNRIGIPAAIP